MGLMDEEVQLDNEADARSSSILVRSVTINSRSEPIPCLINYILNTDADFFWNRRLPTISLFRIPVDEQNAFNLIFPFNTYDLRNSEHSRFSSQIHHKPMEPNIARPGSHLLGVLFLF